MTRWWEIGGGARSQTYDERWRQMEQSGRWVHGEADLVCWFEPRTVLDAGCGTGRVAVELHRRGLEVVGVDVDPQMLGQARGKTPEVTWIEADLVDVNAVSALQASTLQGATEMSRRPYPQDQVDVDSVSALQASTDGGFDLVVMAGNVMVFVDVGSEPLVVANMARHLVPGGRLVSGFQLMSGRLTLADYDRYAADAGMVLEHRWATWERSEYANGDYAVSVHRL